MPTPKRHTQRKTSNGIIKVIAALILIVLIVWLWHKPTVTSSAPTTTLEQDSINAVGHSSEAPLEAVRIPDDVKSEMLRYPGFTVSFNSEYKQPNYVVWELTRKESKSHKVQRNGREFSPDPDVEGCPDLSDYQGSGYDRGHMAPAGDMKWSEEAMNSCFYLTNMSPQNHTLNSGSWNSLEDKCRQWAKRDSAIVIVCGPVLTDQITRYIGRNKVAVPERYFKVILAPYANPPRGIGFIMPNKNVDNGMQPWAVSIDEVEAVTGFDFFAALPDDVEHKVESECNFARWTRR